MMGDLFHLWSNEIDADVEAKCLLEMEEEDKQLAVNATTMK